ncbi:hypothetical protein JI664_17565 [Rhodobacter sp. NTK016B]|uniref:hypothetical protein n=1 Tax=Rhodobacter sp. NTK016B TaxID=2759676 RepID=UPI001A8D3125|nr:hypothetical protein [Rhodobacter sp. NTK016B]MBN8293784.1 hypothetical protein [Rhodobacter sp. NTK016B]
MPRIVPALSLSASLWLGALCLIAPVAEAQRAPTPEEMAGSWMGIGDMLGLLPGHIEALTIGADGAAQSVVWRAPGEGCADASDAVEADEAGCALPVPVFSGAAALENLTVRFVPDDEAPAAGAFPGAPAEPLLALSGGAWTMFRADSQMMISREAEIRGASVPLLRIFVAVEPDFPAVFYDYAVAMELDMARTLCPVTLLHANPADWARFTDDLTAAAPALRAARTGETPASDAVEAAARLQSWADGSEPLPEGTTLLPALAYPARAGMVEPVQDCLTRAFGG